MNSLTIEEKELFLIYNTTCKNCYSEFDLLFCSISGHICNYTQCDLIIKSKTIHQFIRNLKRQKITDFNKKENNNDITR